MKTIELTNTQIVTVIHLNELFENVKAGYTSFRNSILYQEYLESRQMKQLGKVDRELINDFLRVMDN